MDEVEVKLFNKAEDDPDAMGEEKKTQDESLLDPAVPALSCMRRSVQPCINQGLVDALSPLREWRFLKYGTGHEKSMSYATAISAIIGTPFRIESVAQARKLPKVGEKLANKIQEFLTTGRIEQAERIVRTDEFRVLKLLQQVHGIGHASANELYCAGVRNLNDLFKAKPTMQNQLKYVEDMNEKIHRCEVESIHAFIRLQLDRVKPDAETILTGGYRRGKEFSNDVDILITYPHRDGEERGVLKALVDRLQKKGFIPPDGLFGISFAGSERTIAANRPADRLDALDKANIIFRHPVNSTTRPEEKFRRVDLVVSPWKTWGCAVVAWSGSTQFERDLRRYAKPKNLKFDAGGFRTQDTDAVVESDELSSERGVFRFLGLEYLPPTERCADP
ncbi:hypothetical protein JCM11251_006481 [Rhodosporidiobolus azoricus]